MSRIRVAAKVGRATVASPGHLGKRLCHLRGSRRRRRRREGGHGCVSWHFLQGPEEASWAGSCLDGAPSALLSLMPTAAPSCSPASATGTLDDSPSGMTCEPSTDDRGEDTLTLSAGGFPARTSRRPVAGMVSTGSEADSGARWPESLARWDRDSCSWRTAQFSLLGGSTLFSETWPTWGLMRDGECWALDISGCATPVPAFGFWLSTVCASEHKDIGRASILARLDRGGRVARNICARFWKTPWSGDPMVSLNPSFAEAMMGWPEGHSDSGPLATDKFQQWLRSHGAFSEAP